MLDGKMPAEKMWDDKSSSRFIYFSLHIPLLDGRGMIGHFLVLEHFIENDL